MAKLVRGCSESWQLEGTGEPKTNPSVPQQGGQRGVREGEAIADYDQDLDYEPE